jgi:aminoglycoside phosphotransferase (APT) family kinase protein
MRRHGLRVPAVLPTADGRRRVGGLVLFEWLDGDPPVTDRDWRRVERTLRDLHRLTHAWPQRPSFRSTQDLLHEDRGGDVRLDLMPAEAVQRCRAAWRPLAGARTSVVHGDPGASNIRISAAGAGLFDWDEARVDAPILDLAALPLDQIDGVTSERLAQARTALDAWEAANGWVIEPAYARRRLSRLR